MKDMELEKVLKIDLGEDYDIVKKLGQGGFGSVYLVLERSVGKYWAIKVFEKKSNSRIDEIKFQTVVHEAKMLSKLQFPRLPRFSDQIKSSYPNIKYLKMDYIDGKNLKEIDMKNISEEVVIEWGKQLCEILNYLHTFIDGAIYYLDLKPDNIILMNHTISIQEVNSITLVDFGIAVQKGNDDKQARGKCTRSFCAPEQLSDMKEYEIDGRSDIYSLGTTMFYLLSKVIYNDHKENGTSVRTYNPSISRGLDRIIAKCLENNPKKRFQSAQELYIALCNPKQYDPLEQKNNKKKLIIFTVILVLSTLCLISSFSMLIIEKRMVSSNYESLIASAQSDTDVFVKRDKLYDAIKLQPNRIEAYYEIISSYKDNQIFDSLENEEFNKNVKDYIKKITKANDYADVCNEIGKLYFYYYDYGDGGDSSIIKQKEALYWFNEALLHWRKKEGIEYEIAKIYSDMFHLEALLLDPEGRDDQAIYLKNFENMKQLIQDIHRLDELPLIVIARMCEISVNYVSKYLYELKLANISRSEMEAFLNDVQMIMDTYPPSEKLKEIFINVQNILDYLPNAIDAIYLDRKGD